MVESNKKTDLDRILSGSVIHVYYLVLESLSRPVTVCRYVIAEPTAHLKDDTPESLPVGEVYFPVYRELEKIGKILAAHKGKLRLRYDVPPQLPHHHSGASPEKESFGDERVVNYNRSDLTPPQRGCIESFLK